MGASVGIGGLIIGISMLVVFSMAITAFDSQVESSLVTIESASVPLPSIAVENANMFEHAIHSITATTPGSGFTMDGDGFGWLTASNGTSTDCSGFEARFVPDGNDGIGAITVLNHGNCKDPVIVVDAVRSGLGDGDDPVFSTTIRSYVYSNLTNTGSVTIPTEEILVFFDGSHVLVHQQTMQNQISHSNLFSGETTDMVWRNVDAASERLTFTVGETTVSQSIVKIL
ncbi:MAG: hypothetical protein CMA63_00540 [Euryarchaeota archaeon]|nr:hypothetical protein [Euryarchaeota archaeon]|tara:strand:- start:11172 stop:11855 length:684 start_codon:yes stop_codon:yes gene_type:complete